MFSVLICETTEFVSIIQYVYLFININAIERKKDNTNSFLVKTLYLSFKKLLINKNTGNIDIIRYLSNQTGDKSMFINNGTNNHIYKNRFLLKNFFLNIHKKGNNINGEIISKE